MSLSSIIKNTLVKSVWIFFKFRKSRCIFYHDIHSEVRFTNMSNSVELFKDHVETIRNSGFEIVHEITKEYNRSLFLLMMDGEGYMRI